MLPKVTGFAFTNFSMPEDLKTAANYYIEKNFPKSILSFDNNLFDIRTLSMQVNLDCMNCHMAHKTLCCEGIPYPLNKSDRFEIEQKSDEILKNTLNLDDYQNKKRLIEEKGIFNENGYFTSDCGSCIFFNQFENSSYGCSIHKYALDNHMDYTHIKPSSCLMFPMDVLTLDNGGLFVFGLDNETAMELKYMGENGESYYIISPNNKGFSTWHQSDLNYLCINPSYRTLVNKEKGEKEYYHENVPDNIFLIENYKPLFEAERSAIIYLFGDGVCQESCRI